MHKGRSTLVILLALLCCSLSAWASSFDLEPLVSATRQGGAYQSTEAEAVAGSVGEIFYEIASEIYSQLDARYSILNENQESRIDNRGPQAEQAIILLTAAKELGSTAEQIQPLLIKLACDYSQQNYSQQVYYWLQEYVSGSIDLEVAKKAIRYLLDRLNSREQREKLLQDLLARLGGKNAALSIIDIINWPLQNWLSLHPNR